PEGQTSTKAGSPGSITSPNSTAGKSASGSAITATSTSGSKATTSPVKSCPSWLSTCGSSTPATTCALVSTRSSVKAKPDPVWLWPQPYALPVIRTEDSLDSSTDVVGTGRVCSTSGASSSSAKSSSGSSEEFSTSARTSAIQTLAPSGVSAVVVATIREFFNTLVIPGTPIEATEKAISEISSPATRVLPMAPKNLSMVRMTG